MAITDSDRLRMLLGEVIPSGGTETDTLFTDEQILDLLARHGTPGNCCAEGWSTKAALLASMIDIADGDSKESMSQLHTNAIRMAKYHTENPPTSSPGTSFVKINRGGAIW